jgi:hypothetical protein
MSLERCAVRWFAGLGLLVGCATPLEVQDLSEMEAGRVALGTTDARRASLLPARRTHSTAARPTTAPRGAPLTRAQHSAPRQPVVPRAACGLATVFPEFGAFELRIRTQPTLAWTRTLSPSDLATVSRTLQFTELETGADVPFTLSARGRGGVAVLPGQPLHFGAAYALELPQWTLRDGTSCPGTELAFATGVPAFRDVRAWPAPVRAIAEIGDWVVGGHPGLSALSVYRRQGASLTFQALEPISSRPTAFAVAGDRLYVAAESGLLIFELTGAGPTLLGQAATAAPAVSIAVQSEGHRQRVALGLVQGAGTALFEVRDTEAPVPLGAIAGAPGNSVLGVAWGQGTEADLLAVAEDLAGLRLIDVTRPAAPTVVDHDAYEGAHGVAFRDPYWIVSYRGAPRVFVYHARDLSPWVARYDEPCSTPCAVDEGGLALVGDQVFVGLHQGGVRALQLGADGSLTPAARWQTETTTLAFAPRAAAPDDGAPVWLGDDRGVYGLSGAGAATALTGPVLGDAQGVARLGDVAYVAAGFAGLQVFELTEDAPPRWLHSLPLPGAASAPDFAGTGVAMLNGGLVVSDGRAGVSFFDLSEPTQPTRVGSFTIGFDFAGPAVAHRSIVYVCNGNRGFEVFDWSVRAEPRKVASVAFESANACNALAVDAARGLLWVAAQGEIQFYALSNPALPAFRGASPLAESAVAWDLVLDGDVLWLATFARSDFGAAASGVTRRVQRFDVTSGTGGVPVALRSRWRSAPLGSAQRLLLLDHNPLLVTAGERILVFDTASPNSSPYTEVRGSSPVRALLAAPSGLYAVRGPAGFDRVSAGGL